MEQLKGLPLGRQLILGAGVLLFIDTLLHWQQVSFGSISAIIQEPVTAAASTEPRHSLTNS